MTADKTSRREKFPPQKQYLHTADAILPGKQQTVEDNSVSLHYLSNKQKATWPEVGIRFPRTDCIQIQLHLKENKEKKSLFYQSCEFMITLKWGIPWNTTKTKAAFCPTPSYTLSPHWWPWGSKLIYLFSGGLIFSWISQLIWFIKWLPNVCHWSKDMELAAQH